MSTTSSFLTIREAAARLGVHESTVRRYSDQGLIGVKRLPSGVRRLRETDVDALVQRMEGGNRDSGHAAALSAPPVAIEDLAAPSLWKSGDELEEFLALTYAERDRDR